MTRYAPRCAFCAGVVFYWIIACGGAWAEARPNPSPNHSEASSPSQGVVNLNTATVEELMRLPGIGPKKAEAIVDLRQKRKGFQKIQDVLKVRGIGRKTLQRLQPMLTLTGPTTLGKPSLKPGSP